MLTRDREIGRSLQQVDPQDRALLDLSLRRRIKDEVVAAVLRLQPEQIPPLREAALDRLAAQMGIKDQSERARLATALSELPADQWPTDSPSGESPNGHREQQAPEPAPEPEPAERRPRRRRRPLAALAVIVVGALAGAAIGLVLFGGDADDDEPESRPAASPPAPSGPGADLAPLAPDFPGRGSARIEGTGGGSRLVMSLRDLPPREEAYAVWLYNSVDNAVLVDRAVGARLDVDRRLPAEPSDFEFVDVSREPLDDNPNHSGASVMRVPVADLLDGR